EALPPPLTRFQFDGPVVSGATLGAWSHVPLDAASSASKSRWRLEAWELPLSYRAELPERRQVQEERTRWLADESAANAAGDSAKARDCHAMVERMYRQLVRLA